MATATMTSATIQKYLTADLFKELGVDNLTDEERMHFLEGLGNVLQSRLTFRLMQELSGPAKEKFDELLAKNPNDDIAIAQFLNGALPNFQQIMEEEVAQYKKELIDRMKAKD